MEFNFNINSYFKNEITKIGSRLIPDGYVGDRREIQECITRMTLVLTVLGENSAKAQGLQKVITSGERLRNTDHAVYILIDPKGGSKGQGSILGMLKMGVKHLYVFDASGNHHEVSARCVLDFYIHESKQRMGLGKKLFQYMLKEEQVEPQHLAIDKPSPKFLSFLHKHYGLETIIPQMNNFVVFDGFFVNRQSGGKSDLKEKIYPAGVCSSASRYGSLTSFTQPTVVPQPVQPEPAASHNMSQNSHYGRPAAHKPVSTMGMILQHKTPANQQPSQTGSTIKEEIVPETAVEVNDVFDEPEGPEKDQEATSEVASESEEVAEEDAVAEEAAAIEAVATRPETPSTPLSRCNLQAATAPHLDLKFYHSSLW